MKPYQLLLLTMGIYSTSSLSSEIWVPEKEYPKGSIVTHEGVTYQSRWITIGVEPNDEQLWGESATSWEVITTPEIIPENLIDVVSPYDGQIISSNEELIVEIVSESNDLSSVSIMINDEIITELSAPPFNYKFIPKLPENTSVANLVIIAKTFTNEEKVIVKTLSFKSNETINNDFIVESPQEGQTVLINTPFLVKLNDSDDNSKTSFNIYNNGLLITTLRQSPFEFMWTPTESGFNQIIIEKNTGITTTQKYINVNVVGENQASPVVATVNIPDIIDLEINKPISISATFDTDNGLEDVSFYVNEQIIHKFDKPPYELKWTPTKIGTDTFAIKTNVDYKNPVFISQMSVLSSEIMNYCNTIPEWGLEQDYKQGDIVKYSNKLYISNYYQSAQKPDAPYAPYQSAWVPASCGMVSEMTRPQMMLNLDNNRVNIGDDIELGVDVMEYADSKVKTKLIEVMYGDERKIYNQKESVIYKGEITKNNQIIVKATSSTGLSSTYPIELELNSIPKGNVSYRQGFNESILGNIPFDIIASGYDFDGYIKEIIFLIDDNEVDRKRPWKDGVKQYAVSTLSLGKGEYDVKIILIDNDEGKVELNDILIIK